MNRGMLRSGVVVLVVMLALIALLMTFMNAQPSTQSSVGLSQVAKDVRDRKVQSITVMGDDLRIKYVGSNQDKMVRKEHGTNLLDTFKALGLTDQDLASVKIEVVAPSFWSNWGPLLGSLLPVLLLGGFIFLMMRQAQGGNNQAMNFGKSRARMFGGDKPTVTFTDVAGVEEAKQELAEVVEFLKEPEKFISLGARIPKGVLMVGPPGCGKTLMAKAVAGEAGVPFFSISGSEFVEMFVGVGASRVRDLFEQAKRHSPCIIFIDEVDAVGRHRGAGLGGSHDEREQTLNQILVEMDGFDTDTNVILMAATNRPDILDPALLRPGRFDRRVVIDRPDRVGRRKILDVHVRGKPLDKTVNLDVIAKQTAGFAGADLENLVNEAAILAARRNARAIGLADLQEALEKVIMGPERKSRVLSPEDKRVLAYYEAGHAIVRHSMPQCDPVHKVSIVARGLSGGYVMRLPDEESGLMPKSKFEDEITARLGGRASEEITFSNVTTRASEDMERATKAARAMVTQYGMSERLGPITFGDKEELVFLGREIGEQRNYSDAVAEKIDREVQRIVNHAYERAKSVLIGQRQQLEALANLLLEKETVERSEFEALFNPTAAAAV
ncbi:MAG: ATP-dependent zinc metalloprotease FtsH [Anaerolineae bacterium]